MKAFCLQYALNSYNEFISNKDGVRLLGIDLFQEVVSASAAEGTAHFLEDKPAPPNTIVEDFKAIYNEMVNHDAFVKWPSSSPLHFHRVSERPCVSGSSHSLLALCGLWLTNQ